MVFCKDRHGICDGCDRQKPLVLVHGRGLCVNCETLWGEVEKRVLDEVIDFLNIELVVNQSGYGEALNKLRKKYGVSDE